MLTAPTDPPRRVNAPSAPRRVRGALKAEGMPYSVNLAWDASSPTPCLTGRLGGWLLGEHVRLELLHDELLGTVWSGAVRLAVRARLERGESGERLEVRVAGSRHADTVQLQLNERRAVGVGRSGPSSFEVDLSLSNGGLEGQVGGGRRIRLETDLEPGHPSAWVLVAAAVVADATHREVARALLESLDQMRDG